MGVPFPYTDKPCYVITRSERPPIGQIRFYTGDLKALVHHLCVENGYQVFVDGGATILHQLFMDNLIDTLVISVIPFYWAAGSRSLHLGALPFSYSRLPPNSFPVAWCN